MIGWIIVLVVLGMLAYPLLQIIPSNTQKRQMAFRQMALRKGINVQMRHPDLPSALISQYPDIVHCAAYFKAVDSKLEQTFVALKSNAGDWFWLNNRRPPAAMMAKLLAAYAETPGFCLAIEQGKAGTTLFLVDALPIENLDAVENTLNQLNRVISS